MDQLEQLQALEAICNLIIQEEPERKALTNWELSGKVPCMPRDIDKPLRDGVLFYSSGWGWRLRKGWEDVLSERMKVTE